MHFLADMSSPSCMPVFDAHLNNQDRLDRFQGWCNDKANTSPTQLAAGSIPSPPFPSTNLPSLDIYSFDQWTPLLDMDLSSNPYLGSSLDTTVSGPSFSCGSQDSVSSSPNSSTPPSSIASPLWDDSPCFTSPDLLSHVPSSPFKAGDVGGHDLIAPARPHQGHTVAWPQPEDTSYSIPSGQHLQPLTSLSGKLVTADVPSLVNQSLQGTMANDLSVLSGCFLSPTPMETTALGLYYSDTTQSLDVSLLSTEAENDASIPDVVQRGVPSPVPPAQNWTFRAVDPAGTASRSKRAQCDEACSSDVTTSAPSTTTSCGTKVEPAVECEKCGYLQLTKRMGDFRRHLKKHEADHLSRVVCCGVPLSHPAAAGLRPEHLTHCYDGHSFYGGCGRSYSRMDALQRHLKKSGCISGNAKDHQAWRKLYFRHNLKTTRSRKSAKSSVSSKSQKSSVPPPTNSPPPAPSPFI